MRQILGFWMIGLMIGAFAAVSLALGFRGLVRRAPFRIASRKLYLLSIACYLPALAYFIVGLFPMDGAPLLQAPGLIMPLALSVILLVFVLWIYSREAASYTFMGVRRAEFHNALRCALQKMNLAYEENGGVVHLTECGLDLRALATGWMGLAQLQARQKDQPALLEQIAQEMEIYLEQEGSRPMFLPSAVYLSIGALMAAMTLLFVMATGPAALGLK